MIHVHPPSYQPTFMYHQSYIIHHISPIVSGQYKLALTYFQKDLDISLINQGRLDEKGRGYEIEATSSDESFLSLTHTLTLSLTLI